MISASGASVAGTIIQPKESGTCACIVNWTEFSSNAVRTCRRRDRTEGWVSERGNVYVGLGGKYAVVFPQGSDLVGDGF